jgi:integrase
MQVFERDRALIAVMVYSFARVNAVLEMRVRDDFVQGRRGWVRLHEKGGKEHEVPCHHNLEKYLDERAIPPSLLPPYPMALGTRQMKPFAPRTNRRTPVKTRKTDQCAIRFASGISTGGKCAHAAASR